MAEPDRNWALLTVTLRSGQETIAEAARKLDVPSDAIDAKFGVVPVDRDRQLYAVQVDAAQLPDSFGKGDPYEGPFSDPQIAPFSLKDDE